MSKITWADVIENIDLSDKPVRSPKRLSQGEIADIKAKCNPRYDITILDLICTIEAQKKQIDKLNEDLNVACMAHRQMKEEIERLKNNRRK